MSTKFKLDNKTYDFFNLESKYYDFTAPAVRVKINNTEVVKKEYMGFDSIIVETSINKSSYFTAQIVNAYEIEKRDFKWDNYFKPGYPIEISMGYRDKFFTVFAGVITSVNYEISEEDAPKIIISGLDKSFLMMKGKKSAIWEEKKHSEIVKEIAQKYKLKVEATDTKIKYPVVVQNQQSDYEFLTYIAGLNSFEFFIIGDTLYFRKTNEEKTSLITLTMFKNILEANIGVDIADQLSGVTVRGYNLKKEEIEANAKSIKRINQGDDGVSQIKKLDNKNTVHYIYDTDITKEEAQERADSYLEKNAMSYVNGSLRTIGIPQLIAGRYFKISGIWGLNKEKLLYIKSAKHIMSENGYETYLEVGGNAL